MWGTNSMTLYLVIEMILPNGLLGYYSKEKIFVTDIKEATRFQNKEQINIVRMALHPDPSNYTPVKIVVDDTTNEIVKIEK